MPKHIQHIDKVSLFLIFEQLDQFLDFEQKSSWLFLTSCKFFDKYMICLQDLPQETSILDLRRAKQQAEAAVLFSESNVTKRRNEQRKIKKNISVKQKQQNLLDIDETANSESYSLPNTQFVENSLSDRSDNDLSNKLVDIYGGKSGSKNENNSSKNTLFEKGDHTNLSHSRNTEEVSLLVNENDDDLFDGMNLSIDDIPSNQLVSSLNLQQVRITHQIVLVFIVSSDTICISAAQLTKIFVIFRKNQGEGVGSGGKKT